MKTHLRTQIVILGGGFGGLSAALELARQVDFRHRFNVTLIDRNCYHLYHGLLYEVATADFEIRPEDIEYLQGGVCIRLKSLGEIVTKQQIDFVQAVVTGVDLVNQRILCSGQPDLPFDHLVIALGSEPTDFGIPGIKEQSVSLRDIPDALAIRDRVRELIRQSASRRKSPLSVIVGGGGFTGVEFAGELMHFFNRLMTEGKISPNAISVKIIEAGPRLLSPLGSRVGEIALQRLRELGVTVEFNSAINKVEKGRVLLKKGVTIPFDLLVWTGGVKANALIEKFGMPTEGRGQLVVEPTLRVRGATNVWAVGDCIVFRERNGAPIPQVAPLAMDAGRCAARNIVYSLRNQPLKKFQPRHFGFVVPVGGKFAIARTRFLNAHGFVAWILRKLIDLNYFMTILTFRNALRVFFRGARVYLKND